jgi:hypothetical protein
LEILKRELASRHPLPLMVWIIAAYTAGEYPWFLDLDDVERRKPS